MKRFFTIMFFILVSTGTAQRPDTENIFRLAQSFEQQGDYERAVELYADLFKKDTANYPFFEALRRSYIQLKRYDDALRLSLRRLRSTPYDFTLQANIGSLFFIAGQEQQSDSVWNAVLASSNRNPMFYRAVASEQSNQRLFDKAIGTYLRGRRESGDPYLFANELGYLYSFMMDYRHSVQEYLLLLRQNELQYDFIQSRFASIVAKPDGLRAAVAVVAEEIAVRKSIPLLRLQLWLAMEDKRFSDAFSVAATIEQMLNSNGVELFQFAERLAREREFRVAADAYTSALAKQLPIQHLPAAKFGYARCIEELSAAGDSSAGTAKERKTLLETQQGSSTAIELYADVAKEYPYTNIAANALYRIGWIRYKQMFDLDGALAMFDSVLTVAPAGPMIPTVLSTLGEIYLVQNKLDKAQEKYIVMSRSAHSGPEQRNAALFRLAEIQFFKNNFDSALSVLHPLTENLKADETNDALILQYFITENKLQYPDGLKQFARAGLFSRQNKLSEAAEEFLSIVDLYPAAPLADDALLKTADLMIRLRRYNDALTVYNKLLDEYKTSGEKEKTAFRIGELYQFHLNDKEKAIQSYEIILEKYPFSLFAEEARKRIRQLRGDLL